MEKYAELDKRIIAAIQQKKNPLYAWAVAEEADRLAATGNRDAFRITDARLQALRKAGRIQFLAKSEAKRQGLSAGWNLCPSLPPEGAV